MVQRIGHEQVSVGIKGDPAWFDEARRMSWPIFRSTRKSGQSSDETFGRDFADAIISRVRDKDVSEAIASNPTNFIESGAFPLPVQAAGNVGQPREPSDGAVRGHFPNVILKII